VTNRDQFRVSVILYPEDGLWIAQGIEFDITARGWTPIEASERFNDKFAVESVMSFELGDSEPLAGVGAAPQEFWTMYKNAPIRVIDETSFHLAGGTTSQARPEIRITDRRLRHDDAN
jgi:hypothetical protein